MSERKIRLKTPLRMSDVRDLRVGDIVFVSGIIYTARDLAHIRMRAYFDEGKFLPFDLKNYPLYHAGPNAIRKESKWIITSLGPTTSIRMEPYSEMIGKMGVALLIGKGGMKEDTKKNLIKYGMAYLCATPGCGVLGAQVIKNVEDVYWLDLGIPEAIWKISVERWGPLIVAMDSDGGHLFEDVTESAKGQLEEIMCQTKQRIASFS